MAVRLCLALCSVAFLAAGCGSDVKLPKVQPVTGTVMYEGKPLEGANVVLVPSDTAQKSAGATTDAEGKFSVMTYIDPEHQIEGALPGNYGIAVTKMEVTKSAEMTAEQMMSQPMAMKAPKSLLPKKYSAPMTSGFKVTVGEDAPPEPLTLDLK